MSKQAFIVTGLGYGDEGKGTITHWLSHRHRAHTVIRTGGPQALHHVVTASGKAHVFSQFGSGTLRGSATHLSRAMLIEPHGILCEGDALVYQSGIRGVFEMMTIHEDALVISPFQAIAGRVRELVRGAHRRGSVGIGVGETIRDSEILGDRAIRVKDLIGTSLRAKLEAIQSYKWQEFEHLADRAADISEDARERVQFELFQMASPDTIEWAMERFAELARRVRTVDTGYVATHILGSPGTVVLEGSQGVLLDRYHGFHPYTTQVRTTPAAAHEYLRECGYDGDVKSLGILRAYHTRHGGGPFVSESAELTKALPDEINKEHPWQGNFRVGHFDLIAARYALAACGSGSIDGLAITCIDRIAERAAWHLCDAYDMSQPAPDEMETLFQMDDGLVTGINVSSGLEGAAQLARQEVVGRLLGQCVPKLAAIDMSSSLQEVIDVCVSTLQEKLSTPVVVVSTGQTEQDKIEIEKGQ
jgi:adenylosuccinate synthase